MFSETFKEANETARELNAIPGDGRAYVYTNGKSYLTVIIVGAPAVELHHGPRSRETNSPDRSLFGRGRGRSRRT